MKVTMTRNPSKELTAELSGGDAKLEKQLVEGETVDLPAKQAQLAIEQGVAEPASAEDRAKMAAEEAVKPPHPTPMSADESLELKRARRDPDFREREAEEAELAEQRQAKQAKEHKAEHRESDAAKKKSGGL